MHDQAMDPVKTAPFELGSGEDACLLVHGFTGSPWEMRPLGEALAARGYFVKGIRLPGHGETPRAMERAGAREWEAAVFDALTELSSARQVLVAGLSVGALLSVILAAERPSRVAALALLAPAMRFHGWRISALRQLQRLPLIDWSQRYTRKTGTDIECAHQLEDAPILAGFPLSRMMDIWKVQARARERMGRVLVPSLVVAARNDHVVVRSGAEELAAGLVNAHPVRLIEVTRGCHIIPRDYGASMVSQEVGDFFDRVRVRVR